MDARVSGDATIELLDKLCGAPEPQLVRALRLTGESGPVFARGRTEHGFPVLAAWCAPYLAVEKGTKSANQ